MTPTKTDIAHLVRRAIDGVDPASAREVNWLGDDDVGPRCATRCGCGRYWPRCSATPTSTRPPDRPSRSRPAATGHQVEIRVRDFGPGIPAHLANAVFEPFRRLGRGTVPGTGLGLYIARQLTEAMGGQIWVEDAGPGAEFHLTIATSD